MKVKDSYKEVFANSKKILVVFSHPDDAEVIAGGLIARLIANSKEVRLVVTTNGGKGMQDKRGILEKDFALRRIDEQLCAGEILGIKKSENFNLQIPDGEFENSIENIEKIVFHIRQFKPDTIITHNPTLDVINFNNKAKWVNHRDHRLTGQTVLDAAYPYSRDRGFFPDQFLLGLSPHTVNRVLISDSYTHKDVKYFSIDDYIDKKREALKSHPSALKPEYADDYIEENLYGESYFEPLLLLEIY